MYRYSWMRQTRASLRRQPSPDSGTVVCVWWSVQRQHLHYDIPGLNRWELAYVVGQTQAVLLDTDTARRPTFPSRHPIAPAHLPPPVSLSSSRQLPPILAEEHCNWKFLESDLVTRRFLSFISAAEIQSKGRLTAILENLERGYCSSGGSETLDVMTARKEWLAGSGGNQSLSQQFLAAVEPLGFSHAEALIDHRFLHPALDYLAECRRDGEGASRLRRRPSVRTFVNTLRLAYMGQHFFSLDVRDARCRGLFSCSALTLLINLNVLEKTLFPDLTQQERLAKIAQGFQSNIDQICGRHFFHEAFPSNYQAQILRDVGFSERAVADILLTKGLIGLSTKFFEAVCAGQPQEALVADWRQKLEVLAHQGPRIGIKSSVDIFKFILFWPDVMQTLNKLDVSMGRRVECKNLKMDIHPRTLDLTVKVDRQKFPSLGSFLPRLFAGHMTEKELAGLNKRLRRIPEFKKKAMRRVVQCNVAYLQTQGFSTPQLYHGLELLFYPIQYIVAEIAKLDAGGGSMDWRREEKALAVVAFNVEKGSKFSLERIYESVSETEDQGDLFSVLDKLNSLSAPNPTGSEMAGQARFPLLTQGHQSSLCHHGSSQLKQVDAWCASLARRNFHTSQAAYEKEPKIKAKIFYLQNPFTALKNYLKFLEVKQNWDPSLDRSEFLEGVKCAVSTTSHLISSQNFAELRGLLSRAELKRLKKEVETEWDDVKTRNISIDREDISTVIVSDFRTQQIVQNKYCDIDVVVLAVKPMLNTRGEPEAPAMIQIETRFHREYTEGRLPDWIITKFRVVKFTRPLSGFTPES